MAKRSSGKFVRRKQDAYDTPYHPAVPVLLEHVEPCKYVEPCAGNGQLIGHLAQHGFECEAAFDTHPRDGSVHQADATTLLREHTEMFITNPPWTRAILHPIIVNLSRQAPTWLFFDADWAYTQQAQPFMHLCHKIVAVGRVKWIEGSSSVGKDNHAWYLFDACSQRPDRAGPTFYPKSPKE